ncbi:phosphoglycerate mutase family protein [Streptomyces antnestii]|uniref:Phosphoglycerate mutase family protein n=1 Tax=Streptomyces antnestii TaxID=2494256 RepID=A0A437PST9_9ACTN|nr:phosphoglycerate mutase family protein [Streptomyces sp. San01]RVU25322.1 phosphoglycerate mutase family protein [Streptomyces sp. San01]
MSVRVTLLAAARSASLLAERFDDDRPLDHTGWHEVQLASPGLVPLAAAELRYCAPTARSRGTAEALGLAPLAQVALRDCDMGRWRGRTLAEVTAVEPGAVDAWLRDPRSAPHGGESLLAFISRVGDWLDTRPRALGLDRPGQAPSPDGTARVVAVAEPAVVRAALVYALKAPPSTYWNLDVRPLSTAVLSGHAGRWSVRLDAAV